MKHIYVLGVLATCLAGALGQECDEVAAVNCASTIPQPSSSGDGVDCKAYLAAAECLKPHQDSCKSNPNYKSVMDSMNTLQQLCGSYSSGGGGCNLVGAMTCMSKSGQPGSSQNPDCAVFREAIACLEPYKEACKSDTTFLASKSSVDAVAPFCAGDANCNPQKCLTDAGIDPTDNTASQNCDSIVAVQTCLQGQSSACVGNTLYTIAQSSLQQFSSTCGGGALTPGSCNYQEVESCVSAAGGAPSSNGEPKCFTSETEANVEKCMEKYMEPCRNDTGFKALQGLLQTLKKSCIEKCNYQECNIDFTFPNGIPSKMDYDSGCSAAKNAIQCLEPKLKSCPQIQIGRATDGLKLFCMDSSVKEGLETHKNCLESSKISTNCDKFLSPPKSGGNMIEETQDQECMRIEKYSMCAKEAVSECENEAAGMFAAETARKVITLKSEREGGINCPTGAGAAVLPSILLLLLTTVLAVTRAC